MTTQQPFAQTTVTYLAESASILRETVRIVDLEGGERSQP